MNAKLLFFSFLMLLRCACVRARVWVLVFSPPPYHINADPTFFPGRAATIYYRARPTKALASAPKQKANPRPRPFEAGSAGGGQKDAPIGRLGILHPSVLEKFEIGYPCSALEFSLEPFKGEVPVMWTNDDI
jgi:phenylalanyl-tRNA synthetase beta chain